MPTKLSLEEGVIPSFYSNKISHGFANTISLNAFEFYVFHFTYYMLNDSPNMYYQQNPYYLEQLNNANANPSNIIYYALLESYLNYFVPQSNNEMVSYQTQSSQSSLWKSLSSTTSSLLSLGTASNTVSSKPMSSPQTSTLFKSSILNLKPLLSTGHHSESTEQSVQRIPHDSLGTEIGKCETFLLILTEIWLNHAIPHSLSKKQTSPSKQPYFTPNSDHMRAVRILIKHLHYFANSYNKRMNDTIDIIDSSPLNDMKRSLWSPKYLFQKKLYTFLRLSFDRWPNDTSFRLPLETWLSYVQPWRYTNSLNEPKSYPDMDEREIVSTSISSDDPSTLIDIRWKQFVCDNLLFYTVIFRQIIPRFIKLLDLSSSKNALMLFRITKVFSQQNLSLLIKEAENSLSNSDSSVLTNSWVSNSRASLLSPTIRQPNVNSIVGNLRHPLMELESNTFEYIPLFSHAIKPLIIQLLTEISKAKIVVNEMIISANCKSEVTSDSGPSIVRFIKTIFQLYDDFSQTDDHKKFLIEKNKTKNHLQIASSQLSQLFEVPEPQIVMTDNQNESFNSIDENSSPLLRERLLSPRLNRTALTYEDQSGTPKLTSLGRYQVLNRLCKPELNSLEGNPDEQPVRTFEIYYLVRLLLFISNWINNRYGQKIQRLYEKEGFIGCGPTSYIRVVKNGAYRPPDRVTEVLPARINLRFMANKTYLLYTFIVITTVYILNYSLISFSFLAFVMFFTYLLTKTLLIHLSTGNAIN